MTCLWSEFEVLFKQLAHMTSALRVTMARADDEMIQRDIDLIDLVGSSLVCLLQVMHGFSVGALLNGELISLVVVLRLKLH